MNAASHSRFRAVFRRGVLEPYTTGPSCQAVPLVLPHSKRKRLCRDSCSSNGVLVKPRRFIGRSG